MQLKSVAQPDHLSKNAALSINLVTEKRMGSEGEAYCFKIRLKLRVSLPNKKVNAL